MLVCSSVNAEADQNEVVTDDMIRGYANTWIAEMYEGKNVSIDEVIPMKDGYDVINGYQVSFTSNGEPSGYIVLKTDDTNSEPLIEYSLKD